MSSSQDPISNVTPAPTPASSQSTSSTAGATPASSQSTSPTTGATPASASQSVSNVSTSTGSSSGDSSGGGGFASFSSMGELQKSFPKLYYMIEVAIFMQVKQVQDNTQARIHEENQEAYQDNG